MENFLNIIIFVIGIFFGSFFTLAVYRIPKKEDILIKHSYCPNCDHRLGFFDLFPVFSYIFLGGKCRYCKNKIRPRYLILELLSGFTFLILVVSMKINFLNIENIINAVFLLIYVSVLFIISGIDKENIKIEKSVLVFGFIIEILYIIYLYTVDKFNVYQYVMYGFIFLLILGISKIIKKHDYLIHILYLCLYIIVFCGIKIYILTTLITLIVLFVKIIILKQKNTNIPIGFYLSVSNIILIPIFNIITSLII